MARRTASDSGSVLVLALLLTTIILGVGLTAAWMSSTSSRVSGNLGRRQEAFYAAQAGIERARAYLVANKSGWASQLGGSTACGSNTRDLPTNKGRILCDNGTALSNVPVIGSGTTTATKVSGLSKVTYSVWVRNDWESECGLVQNAAASTANYADCDGNGSADSSDLATAVIDNDTRVVVRSEGVARDGLSYVALEAVIGASTSTQVSATYGQKGGESSGSNSYLGASLTTN
ncbi:MAG: pilus assembly PilX N-terminal domain-containing protein [Deltaproteobacteria bacterium]|nr:pilus assembly PilX N-terminal domain-containing protein [Deltaproteobacteria bacterium]